jgi:3-oxoacyl-[acyl-carrier protein] reductase
VNVAEKLGVVAVLGATGTIGTQIVRDASASGRVVLMLGRNGDKLAALASEFHQPFAIADGHDSSVLESAISSSLPENAKLDAIVNCIGSLNLKAAHATPDAEFREVLETNLFTSFACVKAAGKLMRTNGGSVVLFASAAASIGICNHEAIAAAKAGVIGLARSAAATYAPYNLRFNVIAPGLVKTEMTRRIWANHLNAAGSKQMHALGRFGEPKQISSMAMWLLDSDNDWITGQVIGVDGGLGSILPKR